MNSRIDGKLVKINHTESALIPYHHSAHRVAVRFDALSIDGFLRKGSAETHARRGGVMGTRANPSVSSRIVAAILCALLFVAVFCEDGLAQSAPDPSPQTIPLTLKQAVQLALKKNPQVVASRLLFLESGRESQISRSALLPQASLTSIGVVRQYNRASVERTSRRTTGGPYQFIQAGPAYSQSLLDLPLFRSYQISCEGVREARAQENVTSEDVTASVVTQYILVLRAFAIYDAAKVRVDLAERLYEQASNLQKTGIGLNIDTTRAQVELQNERQNLIDAETSTHTTNYILAELLDLPRDQEPVVTDKLQFSYLPEFEETAAISTALMNRPEMQALASQERITHLEQKSASEERVPQIAFSGIWLYQGSRFNNGIPAYRYQIGFSVPLFTGGRIHAEIAQADLEQKRIEQNRQLLEARIVREVKSAIDELDAARKNVDVANLGLQLANDEVAQADRRFAAGVTTNVEVVTAQDALARANSNQIDALYRFNQSRVNLAQAMGEVQNTYAK
ncbi:MAG TPA: TolC family protein [Terriglobia bacterium]|nr:TolC family protein [Terriglobia bacterium]